MSKQIGIVIAVVVILLIGGVAYIQLGAKSKTPSDSSNKATQNSEDKGNIKGTIKSLLEGGKNVTCTVNNLGEKDAGQGVIYVNDKNMRADFSVLRDGKRTFTHMVKKGDTSYLWGDSMSQGVMMKIDLEAAVDKLPESQAGGIDVNKDFNYTCLPWTVDNSLFTPPSDVKFNDVSSMMNGMKANTTGAPAKSGFACDGITDPTAKTACENALKQYGQ